MTTPDIAQALTDAEAALARLDEAVLDDAAGERPRATGVT